MCVHDSVDAYRHLDVRAAWVRRKEIGCLAGDLSVARSFHSIVNQ